MMAHFPSFVVFLINTHRWVNHIQYGFDKQAPVGKVLLTRFNLIARLCKKRRQKKKKGKGAKKKQELKKLNEIS